MIKIPFHTASVNIEDFNAVLNTEAHTDWATSDHFRLKCEQWLSHQAHSLRVYLTPSCTDALEMAAILADIRAGDEVIMPSFTFPSTANAFILRGAIPVFVDIRPDTLNIDETLIEAAITPKTRAIVPVHYAGNACEMDTIMAIANKHKLIVIEDAAQGVYSFYKNRALGSIGHLGVYSFHATKNIHCGDGGALLINDNHFLARANAIRDKGTNRQQFLTGNVAYYTWVDIGSSFTLNAISSALLWSQLLLVEKITALRNEAWAEYHQKLGTPMMSSHLQIPPINLQNQHNAHIFYILLASLAIRDQLQHHLEQQGIQTTCHYQPLHNSPAGSLYSRSSEQLTNTINCSQRILRLPLWPNIPVNTVCMAIMSFFNI